MRPLAVDQEVGSLYSGFFARFCLCWSHSFDPTSISFARFVSLISFFQPIFLASACRKADPIRR